MRYKVTLEQVFKYIIWLGLAVVLFSPLYLNRGLFFPYIVTKTIAFNVAIEIMLLAYLLLAWKNKKYQIRVNLVVFLFAVYILLTFVSSLLGDNFYRSFWSNNERSEGILLLLHLFVLLVIMSGFLRQFRDWLKVFDLFFLASLLQGFIALGQFWGLPWILASSGEQRLAGTIGNAGYMAGYLMFAIFLGIFLIAKKKQIYWKIYYLAGIFLSIFIVIFTETRGAWVALGLCGLAVIVYLLFYYWSRAWLKILGVTIIILAMVALLLLWANKNSSFVANNRILNRMTEVSLNTRTAQNRLIAWQSAYLGFKDRPILGWGYENYYQPFDKYFNPKIYRHEGSVVWFDRAHNLIFDRLVAGGILGLGSYLAFLILPFCYLWRYYFKKAEHKNKYFLPVVFSLIALAYFIQNLFIFEALVIYVPLFMVLAFVGLYAPYYQVRIFDRLSFRVVVALIWLVAIIPIVYLVNVKPLQANMELFSILVGKDAKVEQKIDLFKSLLARDTYGNQEYRKQLHFFLEDFKNDLDTTIKNNPEQVEKIINQYSPTIIELSNFTKAQINRQIEENPYSASNYLLAMKYNNFVFTRIKRFDILAENTKLFNQAKTLSPKRQHIYFELGYTYLHLAQALKTTGQDDLAQEAYQVAISQFEFALSLNDHNFESYKQLIFANILAGYNESAINLYTLAKNTGVAVNEITVLSQIIATAEFADNTEMIQYFSDKLKSSNQID